MQTNVFQQAREYFATPRTATAYRRYLLQRIHGNGFKLTRRNGSNYLVDGLDNRKQWVIT